MSTTSLRVTKNNGTLEELDMSKINDMVSFAFEGSSLDKNELLQKINVAFYDKIPTSEIQKNIIHEAKLFIVPDSPNNNKWALVAGRLEMAMLHGEIFKNTSIQQNDFYNGYCYLKSIGLYKYDIPQDLLFYASTLMDTNVDFTLPYQSVVSLKSTYLLNNDKGSIEYPQWAILMDSLILADGDKELLKEYYNQFKSGKLSPATPTKGNLRIKGNTASCFSILVLDNIEDIMDKIKEASLISKNGGGLAVYVGKIRPSGSPIQNIPNASTHINKWVGFFDKVANTVDQLGENTRPAI